MTKTHTRSLLITGAASGIGAAIARRCAGPGTALLLHTGTNAGALDTVAADCRAAGSDTITALGDLAEPSTAAGLVEQARKSFGRIDQIVSNAGKAAKAPFGAFTQDDLMRDLASMPGAFAALVTAALPDLETSPQGRVVAISSFVAHVHGKAGTLFPTTSAAKAALEALVAALALQLAPHGTTVNAVMPGFTRKQGGGHLAVSSDTLSAAIAATPTGRLTEPGDVAAAVAFLLSPEAAQITGTTLRVDGGLTLG
ncbi:SDR family NAD(P)-dependent oxidoreductase [Celeribacter indicus]|uniref:Short chain alcohol dehydrogenase-related dehydrogenase n=1 Tax=Celeribacter indicus TaxID=1208324 RepID=A0A0B5DV23_9RHOB|nr:SDR family oxidoreductase [Celeribacter indicus]AJE46874.1 short chain alcohol dehydrogenase-related dehydrogenase [Celeribacter indicus]SDW79730.1 NAD(P)-dependent dehydrogenase, short-chain alcohol dehydrogenase family [Celeribacter indicus]